MKQWLKRIFYMPKHSKPTDEKRTSHDDLSFFVGYWETVNRE